LRPDAPLVIVILLATVAVWWSRRLSSPWPRRLLVAFAGVFYLAATPIGASVLTATLAHGLTPMATRAEARGAEAVVLLGGGIGSVKAGDRMLSYLVPNTALRIFEAARVYTLIGARFVIVSGGIAGETELRPEGELMAEALVALGVPADRILMDLSAKNTHQHPIGVRPLLEANHIRQFVLVTSPTHMRRSLAVFRAAGYDPVPSVGLTRSDHLRTALFFLPNDDSLGLSDEALYEFGGFALYWWRGWLG
jgi:uncharacterized SAM-binding protein YcdF (DUF218 family)